MLFKPKLYIIILILNSLIKEQKVPGSWDMCLKGGMMVQVKVQSDGAPGNENIENPINYSSLPAVNPKDFSMR